MDIADRIIEEANTLMEKDEDSVALSMLERTAAASLNILGMLYLKKNYRPNVALEAVKTACLIDKGNHMLRSNLSHVYNTLERHEEAAVAGEVAMDMSQNLDHSIAFNTAIIMNNCQRLEESLKYYEIAIKTFPPLESLEPAERDMMEKKLAQIKYNYGSTLMANGNYKKGLAYYESRLTAYAEPASFTARFKHPYWKGESLRDKKLLIYSEQGIGDLFQFCRYLDFFEGQEAIGAEIVMEAQEAAVDLLEYNYPYIKFIPRGNTDYPEPPDADYAVSVCSLPYLLGYDDVSLISGKPYLKTRSKKPPRVLEEAEGLKVGLAWAGNPGHGHDYMRSCPLKHFRCLADVPGVTLFSLQKDTYPLRVWKGRPVNPHEGIDKFPMTDITPFLKTFSETAVCLQNLDLLISIDSATAHLAGALGTPVWMLNAFIPDWRWMKDRSDTIWYESMKLYRQKKLYDWDEMMSRVRDDLAQLATDKAHLG